MGSIAEHYLLESYKPEIMIVDGERAAVMSDVSFKQRATDRTLRFRVANFLRFQDGKVIEFREFANTFDVVEQALGRELQLLLRWRMIYPTGPLRSCAVPPPATLDSRHHERAKQTRSADQGATGDWEVVIGMEVHAQVTSKSKLFSGASTEFGGAPNSHVSLVDAAMPGMLPVINEECVRQAIRTGLGLKAKINLQIGVRPEELFLSRSAAGLSDQPVQIAGGGRGRGRRRSAQTATRVTVGIERLHLEQDAGKSLHDRHPTMSYVDLNRSGVALMEIVSKPDLRSSEEAKAFLTKLRSILRYLGTCDGDMEKGSLRADVNVSVRKPGEALGTRCEIKNVNSIRFIGQAIEHEARRQIEIIEDGGKIEQETRLFDAGQGRDALDALQGRGARLPLFPRSRSAAAGSDGKVTSRSSKPTAGTAGREEGALHARLRALGL